MYTHVGNGMILKNKDVIGIFDMKTIQSSRENKRIQFELKNKKIIDNNSQSKTLEIKSVILMDKGNNEYIEEISPIAVSTLKKRLEKGI
ncbi:MAG: DUF370 domain-containing protein [Clostridia bacterium]|nr:DUF370 domain-containing protein [Clostridia bacterium]